MLELRPTCEHCDKSLPPDTNDARICSFECTFCCDCAEHLFAGVCPNCGGNFVPRPIRPARDWKGGNFLGRYPASGRRVHKPVDAKSHAELVARVGGLDPTRR